MTLRIALGALLLLALAGRFLPGPLAWGFNHLHYLPMWIAPLWAIAALALFWPPCQHRMARLFQDPLPRLLFESHLVAWLLPLAAAGLFVALRERSFFMGDGYLVGELVSHGRRFRGFDSLDYLFHFQIFQALHRSGSKLSSFFVYRAGSVLAGVAAVILFRHLLRRIAWEPWRRAAAFLLFFTVGPSAFFFGYVESYSYLFLFLSCFLITAVAVLQNRAPLWLASLFFGLAFAFHLTALFAAPALLYLALRAQVRPGRRRWAEAALPPLLLFALAVTFHVAAGYDAAWFRKEFLESKNAHSMWIPLAQGRGLLTPYHWKDLLNLALITAPACLAVVLSSWHRLRGRLGEMPVQLLLIQLGSILVLNIALDRKLGGARDWDILAAHAGGLILLAASLLPGGARQGAGSSRTTAAGAREIPRAGGRIGGRAGGVRPRGEPVAGPHPTVALVCGAALLLLFPWVLLLNLETRSIARFVAVAADFPPFQRAYAYEEVGKYYRKAANVGFIAGVASYRKPEMGQAQVMCERCVAAFPENARFRNALGYVYFIQGKMDLAEEQYRAAWQSDPRNTLTLEMLGRVATQEDNPLGALDWFRRLVEVSPNNPAAWEMLAITASHTDAQEDIIRGLRRVMELDPRKDYWNDLGQAYLKTGRFSDAAHAFEQALSRGTETSWTRLALIDARIEEAGASQGKPVSKELLDEADREVAAAMQKDPKDENTLEIMRGLNRIRQGKRRAGD